MSRLSQVEFRLAVRGDLPRIVALLADDVLGATRESNSGELSEAYILAFEEIEADANNEILVGARGPEVVAVLQATYIPNLSLTATKRVQIEGVRVSSKERGQGLGKQLFEFAFQRARARGCRLAQLTTNKSRVDAFRFYESLGFKSTHEGMKLVL